MYTVPIKPVPNEILAALHRLTKNELRPHGLPTYMVKGPLREGKTLHLRNLDPLGEQEQFECRTRHPEMVEVLSIWLGEQVVKAYYHELQPGQQIYPHSDTDRYFTLVDRYQIFFDITSEHLVIHGGLKPVLSSNFLHAFDASVTHAYYNTSDAPWGFYVIDCVKPEYKTRFAFR